MGKRLLLREESLGDAGVREGETTAVRDKEWLREGTGPALLGTPGGPALTFPLGQAYAISASRCADDGVTAARTPFMRRYGVLMEAKLAVVVRADLAMGRGKIAAQVAHAAVAAVLANLGTDDLAGWLRDGQPKVVLKVTSAGQLQEVIQQAKAAGLPVELVNDAGRTQVAAGTLTCCAIGPAEGQRIDAITAGLPLL
jgi:PTH2 family peptidyl-tRNA hydrolase